MLLSGARPSAEAATGSGTRLRKAMQLRHWHLAGPSVSAVREC